MLLLGMPGEAGLARLPVEEVEDIGTIIIDLAATLHSMDEYASQDLVFFFVARYVIKR